MATTSYSHLPTTLRSSTHPLVLRTLEPEDAEAFAALLSDPENTRFESSQPPAAMAVSTAEVVIGRMLDSAGTPTVLVDEKVQSGPGRVNLAVVALVGEAEEFIGLGGFGSIKDLDAETGEQVQAGSDTSKTIRVGDVGVMLTPAARGKGYAGETVRLACEWGFRAAADGGLQLDRITAGTLVENQPMLAILEKKLGWTGVRCPAPPGKPGTEQVSFEVTKETWQK
jgi:RimJ/RimL family protein N-acetyltransferase